MKATTKEWLDLAKDDLRNCKLILEDELLTNIIAFHSQQAVEKSFKAFIEEKGQIIPKIHSLQHLFDLIKIDFKSDISQDYLAILDNVYTSSRYPGFIGMMPGGKPTLQEARELFEFSENIHKLIIQTIEKNA